MTRSAGEGGGADRASLRAKRRVAAGIANRGMLVLADSRQTDTEAEQALYGRQRAREIGARRAPSGIGKLCRSARAMREWAFLT